MLIHFFMTAHWIVQLDIIALIFGSIIVWAIIFERTYFFLQIKKNALIKKSPLTLQQSMDKYLMLLATIGSVAPYVGLFGTVCGIIAALLTLSGNAANISTLMPGIGEALMTTALGLVAAIPAIVAYNHLLTWKEKIIHALEET